MRCSWFRTRRRSVFGGVCVIYFRVYDILPPSRRAVSRATPRSWFVQLTPPTPRRNDTHPVAMWNFILIMFTTQNTHRECLAGWLLVQQQTHSGLSDLWKFLWSTPLRGGGECFVSWDAHNNRMAILPFAAGISAVRAYCIHVFRVIYALISFDWVGKTFDGNQIDT